MATVQQVIQLVFEGIDNASDTTKNVAESLGDLNDAVGNISQPFKDLAGDIGVVQAALVAVGGVIGTLAYKESVEFESSLLDLQKQMEDGEGTARGFAGTLESLAIKYGINANELVKSAADFKAAGYDLNTSTALTEQSLKLVIAGGLDAAASVDVMNRALAGFVIPASDVTSAAQKIGDILNKTADITKSSFKELATGFADLSPIAKLTGLSFEETAAILSKVIDVFGSGSEAANGLKSGFLSIIDPSKEAAAVMQDLGVKFNESGKPIGTIKTLLETIGPAFEKMDQSQRLAAASTIFGKEQAAKMVTVLGEYSGAMDLAGRITKEAAGSIEKEVAIRLKAAEQVIASTNEAWRQLLRALGDEIRVDTTGVISSLGDLALSFKKVVESGKLDPVFNLLRGQLSELETTIRAVAKNLPAAFDGIDFTGLVKSFENLGLNAKKSFAALFGEIDLTTVEGLRSAIQQVVDILKGLVNLTAGELGGLAPFLAGIRELTKAFGDATPEAQSYAGTILGFMSGLNKASGIFEGVNTALLGFIAFGPKLAAWGASATGAAAALAGPQGLAVLLGALTASIVTFLVPAEKLADYAWPDWLAGYEGATPGTAAADIADGFVSLTNRIKGFVETAEEVPAASEKTTPVIKVDGAISEIRRYEEELKRGRDEYDALISFMQKPIPISEWDGAIGKLSEFDLSINKINKGIDWSKILPTSAAAEAAGNLTRVGDATQQLVPKLVTVRDANGKVVQSYTEMTNVIPGVTGTLSILGDGLDKTKDKAKEAAKESDNFRIKMEEIASNERIKTIEAVVSLNVAQIEADVERAKATFASIDTTIKSTGDLIGSLFGNLIGTDDPFKASKIESQIALENERRQKVLDIQKQLAEAEIERINAQTRALDRGEAILNVKAEGLQPHLEAIWFEIMKAIRVKVNAKFSDYLLGIA